MGRGLCTMLEDFLWKLVGETFFEHIGENQGASGKAILMTLKPFYREPSQDLGSKR